AVKGCAITAASSEFLLANRVDNHGGCNASTVFASNADSNVRYAASKVDNARDQLDQPLVFRTDSFAHNATACLGIDAVTLVDFKYRCDDGLFGSAANLSDVIFCVFFTC